MGRRIWVIKKGTEITQEILDAAAANSCPEIVTGIPPILKDILRFKKLPLAYEEPEPPPTPEPRDALAEIDDLKVRVKKLEISRI